MVFHPGGHDHAVLLMGKAVGELVDGLGGVLAKDYCVLREIRLHELSYYLPGPVEGPGAEPGLEAGSPVNAGIEGHEPFQGLYGVEEWGVLAPLSRLT